MSEAPSLSLMVTLLIARSASATGDSGPDCDGARQPLGLFVMAYGNRLVSTQQHKLQLLTPAGQLALVVGGEDEDHDATLVDCRGQPHSSTALSA